MRRKPRTEQFRRKREGKTDYRKRLKLLLSGRPRAVIRKSLKNIAIQFVEYGQGGDKVIAAASSKELEKKYRWNTSRSNIPLSYLTGIVAGKKAMEKGLKEAVLDIGLAESVRGSRVYAALKGIVDAGMKINYSEDITPPKEALEGKRIEKYAAALKKENEDKYKKAFSNYLKNKKVPEAIQKYFEETKKKIGVK